MCVLLIVRLRPLNVWLFQSSTWGQDLLQPRIFREQAIYPHEVLFFCSIGLLQQILGFPIGNGTAGRKWSHSFLKLSRALLLVGTRIGVARSQAPTQHNTLCRPAFYSIEFDSIPGHASVLTTPSHSFLSYPLSHDVTVSDRFSFRRPYLTGKFLLQPPPKAPSRAVAKLFGIDPRDGVMINYDQRRENKGQQAESGIEEARLDYLPEAMQEELLLDDLLYALMGFPGR